LGPSADLRLSSVLFVGYVITAIPGVDWLDVGELTASAWDLGVSHPPGQPLPTLLWRMAMLLPIGNIAFRATVVSCACAAAICVPLWSAATVLGRRLPASLLPVFPACVCVVGLLGVAPWAQAVRPEVYAPQLLLAVAVLAASFACAAGDEHVQARAAVWIVALLGLSGATHPLLAMGLAPAAVAGLAFCGWAVLKRTAGPMALAAVAVCGLHLYLPLRSAARPALAWGMPHTFDGFVSVLTGKAFAHNFSAADGGNFTHNVGVVIDVLRVDLGPAVVLLAVVGLVLIAPMRRLGAILMLAIVGNIATVLLQNKVFASNPDLHGYLALTAVVLAVAAVFAVFRGLGWLAERGWESQAVRGAWAALVVLALLGVLAGLVADRSSNRLAEAHGRALIDGLPPGSLK